MELPCIVWDWLQNENCTKALDHKNPIWRDEHGKHIDHNGDDSDRDDSNQDDKHIENLKRKDSGEKDDDDNEI